MCRSVILSTGLDIGIGRIAFRSESDVHTPRSSAEIVQLCEKGYVAN